MNPKKARPPVNGNTPAPDRPSWQTMEFWKTLIALLWPIIMVVFKLNPGDSATLEGAVQNTAATGFSFALAIVALYSFIKSRTDIKKTAILANGKDHPPEEKPPISLEQIEQLKAAIDTYHATVSKKKPQTITPNDPPS